MISIEADEPDNKAPAQPPKVEIREVSKEELNVSVNNPDDLAKLNKIHDVEVENASKQVINEDDDGAEVGVTIMSESSSLICLVALTYRFSFLKLISTFA